MVASTEDPNDVFYQNQENEDIKILSEMITFVDYEDQWYAIFPFLPRSMTENIYSHRFDLL